ncbi:MAG: hypothetical protein ACOCZ5_01725 [bacterium]
MLRDKLLKKINKSEYVDNKFSHTLRQYTNILIHHGIVAHIHADRIYYWVVSNLLSIKHQKAWDELFIESFENVRYIDKKKISLISSSETYPPCCTILLRRI